MNQIAVVGHRAQLNMILIASLGDLISVEHLAHKAEQFFPGRHCAVSKYKDTKAAPCTQALLYGGGHQQILIQKDNGESN